MSNVSGARSGYNIVERGGCRLVTGAVPARKFGELTKGMPEGAVLDAEAAARLGVTFAIGLPEALAKLEKTPAPQVPRVVVWIEGGIVQGALSDSPVEIALIDYDTEGAPSSDRFAVPQTNGDGGTAQAVGHVMYVELDKQRADQLFDTVQEAEHRRDSKGSMKL